jgi:hypothetical protein
MSNEFSGSDNFPEEFPSGANQPYEGDDHNNADNTFEGATNRERFEGSDDGFVDTGIFPSNDSAGDRTDIPFTSMDADQVIHELPSVEDLPASAGLNVSERDTAELPEQPIHEPLHGRSEAHFRLVGPPEMEVPMRTYVEHAAILRANAGFDGEVIPNISSKTTWLIQDGVAFVGRETGAPAVEQRTQLSLIDYRQFDHISHYEAAILAKTGELPHGPVTFLPEGGILWLGGDRNDNITRMAAGTALSAAVQWVTPHPEQSVDEITTSRFDITQGYVRSDIITEGGINAMVVDMVVDRALRSIGMDRADIHRHNGPMAAIGSAAVLHTAEEIGYGPQAIEDMLINGFFTGDPRALQIMQEAFGDDRMEILLALTGRENYEEVVEAAQALGLTHTAGYINNWANNRHMNVYEWR